MNTKMKCKMALDLLMTALLIVLMSYQVVGDAAHEWVGSGMFLCFVLHQLLNLGWYRALGRGRYRGFRLVQTALNALSLLFMLALMGSGILLSQTVFAFLPLRGGVQAARVIHLLASYWGFVCMSLHLGLHWGMMTGLLQRNTPVFRNKISAFLLRFAALVASLYGMEAFFRCQIPTYLFLRSQFVFFDHSRPAFLVFSDYIAMMAAFVWLGYYGTKLCKRLPTKG